MMTLAVALSVLMIAVGGLLVLRPRVFMGWLPERLGWGLVIASTAFRFLFGLCLFFAGMTAHWPDFIQFVGMASILAALPLPLLGPRRLDVFVQWTKSLGTGTLRAGGVLAVALGVLLLVGLGP